MDERLAELDHRVAAAATAWLTDPRDTSAYARLVHAIAQRQAYLHPQLPASHDDARPREAVERQVDQQQVDQRDVDASGAPIGDVDQDEVLDDLGGAHRAPAPIGQDLAGDLAETLRRLRRQRDAVERDVERR